MKTAIAVFATATVLATVPGLAMAKDMSAQPTRSPTDRSCANAQESHAAKVGTTKTMAGVAGCLGKAGTSLAGTTTPDDNGMESANDADSSHED